MKQTVKAWALIDPNGDFDVGAGGFIKLYRTEADAKRESLERQGNWPVVRIRVTVETDD